MTYLEYKHNFIKKHSKGDWTVDTSDMDQYGCYRKTYVFTDGAMLYEVNRPVWRTAEAEVEVEGIKVKITKEIKLFETEAWNTDNAESVYFYELY